MKQFTNQEIEQFILESTKKWHLLQKLGIEFENKNGYAIDLELIPYLNQIGLDDSYRNFIKLRKLMKDKKEEEYNKNPRICKCGKIISFNKRFNKYCSQSCGTRFSNMERPKKSIQEKIKIKNTIKENYINSTEKVSKYRQYIYNQYKENLANSLYLKLKELNYNFNSNDIYLVDINFCLNNNLILNKDNYDVSQIKYVNSLKYKLHKCELCGREFYTRISKDNKISFAKTCSNDCHKKLVSENAKILRQKEKENGTFKGWKPRNNRSYAEKFWAKVLENNNIPYIPEYSIERKGTQNYFLDFYIEKNGKKIDLEIDGKQHKYSDRIEHDKIRDEYISNLGYIIYRIDWNKMDGSKELSDLTKEKINKFLEFYNNL